MYSEYMVFDLLTSQEPVRSLAVALAFALRHLGGFGFGGAKPRGKFDHDFTTTDPLIDDGECKGNHPLLWPNYSG